MKTMTTPKKKRGATPPPEPADKAVRVREGENINVWIAPHLVRAFRALAEREKRTVSGQMEILLEIALRSVGALDDPPEK